MNKTIELILASEARIPLYFGVLVLVISGCKPSSQQVLEPPSGSAASKISSVSMTAPEKLKPYIASGKINGWSLTFAGGECANGGTAK